MTAHIIVPALDPSRRPGDAVQADPHRHPARPAALQRASSSPTRSACRAFVTSTATTGSRCWRSRPAWTSCSKPPTDDTTARACSTSSATPCSTRSRAASSRESRIDQSVYRILALKTKHGLFKHPYVDESKVAPGRGHARAPGGGAADHRQDDHAGQERRLLPLTKDGRKVLVTGYGVTTTQTLANDIHKRGPVTTVLHDGHGADAGDDRPGGGPGQGQRPHGRDDQRRVEQHGAADPRQGAASRRASR